MRRLDPRSWPTAVKVPIAVAALMMLVGLLLSERVLAGLNETQERHLRDLAESYLDGLSSSLAPSILREDTWEVFDAIDRAQTLNKGLRPVETVVTDGDQRVIAASDPRRHPVGSSFRATWPADPSDRDASFSFEAGADTATAGRRLSYPGRTIGEIHAVFDTRHLAAERRDVILTLLATNGALTVALAAAGWLLVRRMMQPVRILTDHLGLSRETSAIRIEDDVVARQQGEFGRLFRAFNALVHVLDERELLLKQLAEEERLGSLGRLASTLAHEINNPLGGLFNALATLKSHGHLPEVRTGALGLLERGLVGMRDVVRTVLAIHRTDGATRDLTTADLDDLQLLVTPEARRKSVRVTFRNGIDGAVGVPSTPVRQAVLNLLLNAIAASPAEEEVLLLAQVQDGDLQVTIADAGPGLPPDFAALLHETAGVTSLPAGGGLGLWTTGRLIAGLGGHVNVDHRPGGGTVLRLFIPIPREAMLHVA